MYHTHRSVVKVRGNAGTLLHLLFLVSTLQQISGSRLVAGNRLLLVQVTLIPGHVSGTRRLFGTRLLFEVLWYINPNP